MLFSKAFLFITLCLLSKVYSVKIDTPFTSYFPSFNNRATLNCDGVADDNVWIKYRIGEVVIYDTKNPAGKGKFYYNLIYLIIN